MCSEKINIAEVVKQIYIETIVIMLNKRIANKVSSFKV